MNKIKKSSDKDILNLRQLLKENILSTTLNKQTQYSKEIYTKANPDQIKKNKKLFSFSMLKYKPKRLINFKGINIPLPTLGKASLDYSKTFGPESISEIKKSSKNKIFNSKAMIRKKNKNQIEELIKDDKLIEFKNKFILKYAQFSENFGKFHQYKDFISDSRKRDFEDLYSKISKSLETQSQLFLNDFDNAKNMYNNNDMSVSPYSTTNIESLKHNFFGRNDNNLNSKKKIMGLCSDYSFYNIRFINILFKEMKEYKNEIFKLLKLNHEYELKINLLTKELEDLKIYINKSNISKKIFAEKEKENSIKKIQNKYIHKENEYLVSMHKLEDEIHSLMQLLDKNKSYYNKYKEAEKAIDDSKKNNDFLRIKFNKELNDKNLQCAIERDRREELLNQLEELNNTINELKEQKEQQKRQEIEINAQILKMKIIIEEKNENLMMMSEELEYYIREYYKEKYNHNNTIAVLRSLENRIYNEEKERKEKNEFINNSEVSSNTNND